ncbi:ArathNictaba 5, phloem protein 2-A1 [Hibiscus trionum]|uniref:ArathNictaba 5, phloem protein 2-A1 n=1 Tax=Hibiscus trionum TaxID=183268 RepID=A0A9W7JLD9_HIBTR|nr:ArathNictaba 5, phloem protein 2-A1 [Hibiscus trionum]
MAASQSQDSEPKLENNSVERKNREGIVVESISSKKTEKIQLPYNVEAILKDSDTPVYMSAMDKLLHQLHSGVFLNRKKKKYWVDKNNKNCFILFARDLNINWVGDNRYWHWTYQKEINSDVSIEIAELVQVCWLELIGKLHVSKLSPGTLYQVVFIAMLRENASGWRRPLKFRLTLPNGRKIEHEETLENKPRENWIEIATVEFETSFENDGEMEIKINEVTNSWKAGLVVKGIAILPKKLS